MSVDEPGVQGLVRLGQKVVQMAMRAPREPARQAQEGGKLGGGDRWPMVSMEGGRKHGMKARGEARQAR